jgi:hypothetical protein
MAIKTIIKVPVNKGAMPYCEGVNKGAQTVPNTCVVISLRSLKVVGRRERTIPTVTSTEITVAEAINLVITN